MATFEDVSPEVLAQFVSRLLAGETIPMSALSYLRLTEYVQAIPDEQTFKVFSRLTSIRNEQQSIGLIAVYDIFLKPHTNVSADESIVAKTLSVTGADRAIKAFNFHDSRFTSSDSEYHYFFITRQAGTPEIEVRVTISRQDDGQFHVFERDLNSNDWEKLGSIWPDWSQDD